HTEQRIKADAREAAAVEHREESRQSANGRGLEVVALGGIVQHHDRAVGKGSRDSLDDALGRLAAHAVVAACGPANQPDARKAYPAYGGDAGVAEGWTEQVGTYAGRDLDRTDRAEDLVAHGPRHAERVQAVVDISVHAERVTAGVNLAHHVRMAARLGAQHE